MAATPLTISKTDVFRFKPFSQRQKMVLTWWMDGSPYKDYDGIIADGSIRSGKTVSMATGFLLWAMCRFDGRDFALCGKTIGSLRRNVIRDFKKIAAGRGYEVRENRSDKVITVTDGDRTNFFHCFGGRDESSQDLIQGMTLAGVLFDEVALMPESFVNQATGRCSVEGSKFWFNCNPEGRLHWFKVGWVNQYLDKRLLYLHFTMDDNLSLPENIKERYRRMYIGVFYQRYILGRWCAAEGVVYDNWSEERNGYQASEVKPWGLPGALRYVAVDYGTTNPTVFLEAWDDGVRFWISKEYYQDSRTEQRQKTPEQHARDLEDFLGGDKEAVVIIDPSAEAFKLELRNRGYRVKNADNDVLDGIRLMSVFIQRGGLMVDRSCVNFRKEIESYVWDEKARERGEEKPVKQKDHCLAGNTLVDTFRGPKKLRDLAGKTGIVWSADRLGHRRPGLFFGARLARKNAEVYRVTVEGGRVFRATGDHRVLTEDGWKRVDRLTEEDRIVDV